MTTTVTPDTEITLTFGNQRAVVSPWGASLRRYCFTEGRETDIVWGYSGGAHKKGGQGDVLIPFPGRIADGRYEFDGEIFQLERNDKEGPNAIHGFVRTLPWTVAGSDAHHVRFEISLSAEQYGSKGYPFSLAIHVAYVLNEQGLSCSFEIKNVGARTAPVGVGFHPYFTVGSTVIDDDEVKIPGAAYVEFNERLAPTGRIIPVAGTEWDYRAARPIGARRLNHCYVQLEREADGSATASLGHAKSGRKIKVTMDRSFSAIVVYTGDAIAGAARRAVAIEPMTCATDAFNHPEWGLQRLPPGRVFSGRYTIRHS
ncbi:MAG: aldose 1-epimerase [Nitrospiraceae bacterium]